MMMTTTVSVAAVILLEKLLRQKLIYPFVLFKCDVNFGPYTQNTCFICFHLFLPFRFFSMQIIKNSGDKSRVCEWRGERRLVMVTHVLYFFICYCGIIKRVPPEITLKTLHDHGRMRAGATG